MRNKWASEMLAWLHPKIFNNCACILPFLTVPPLLHYNIGYFLYCNSIKKRIWFIIQSFLHTVYCFCNVVCELNVVFRPDKFRLVNTIFLNFIFKGIFKSYPTVFAGYILVHRCGTFMFSWSVAWYILCSIRSNILNTFGKFCNIRFYAFLAFESR